MNEGWQEEKYTGPEIPPLPVWYHIDGKKVNWIDILELIIRGDKKMKEFIKSGVVSDGSVDKSG